MTLNKAIFREHPELLSALLGNILQDSKKLVYQGKYVKKELSRHSLKTIQLLKTTYLRSCEDSSAEKNIQDAIQTTNRSNQIVKKTEEQTNKKKNRKKKK